jgi:nicotinamidase-related amidase
LVLVDPYNDFLSEGGKIWPRVKEVAKARDTLQHLRQLLSEVRRAEIAVFYAPHRRWRPGDYFGWLNMAPTQIGVREGQYYMDGTWGGAFHEDLAPKAADVTATEHWSPNGFANTDLNLHLRQHGITHLILAGMTAPGCVEGTGRAAVDNGYTVTLVTDATAAFSEEYMHAAHQLTGPFYASAIITTEKLIAALPQR